MRQLPENRLSISKAISYAAVDIMGWIMKREYGVEFKAKVVAWALEENCGIAGTSKKFDVPDDLVHEWAKRVLLRHPLFV